MAPPSTLVTGATGLLGRAVMAEWRRRGWPVTGTGYSRADGVDILRVDLVQDDQIAKVLDKTQAKVVVHCAAQRFPDKVDRDPAAAAKLNADASATLARLAAARGALLIYISTDYVFPGAPGEAPYETDAQPRPTNVYGQTKLDGERAVLDAYASSRHQQGSAAVVLRVPVLYGHAESPSESAVNVLMDTVWQAQKEPKKVDDWSRRYPTNVEDVARVCHDIARIYLEASDPAGLPRILHFSSEDNMTKYEMCRLFGEIMALPTDAIEPDRRGNEASASVQRPYDCHLGTTALHELGVSVETTNFRDWWRREVGAFRK